MLSQKSKSIEIFLGKNTFLDRHQIKLAYTPWNAFLLRFSQKPVIPARTAPPKVPDSGTVARSASTTSVADELTLNPNRYWSPDPVSISPKSAPPIDKNCPLLALISAIASEFRTKLRISSESPKVLTLKVP